MRIHKKVISFDSGNWLICCWHDCEKQGYELYKCVHRAGYSDQVTYVFCSERHKHYFLNSHRSFGNLPSGMRSFT